MPPFFLFLSIGVITHHYMIDIKLFFYPYVTTNYVSLLTNFNNQIIFSSANT